ncbi:PIN domain-containing protein [Candidatus Woesearchaeota archaeon]|nr:PIN domain-containing protein [Candidatus Woesearchaeota archaeon]
MLRVLFDTNIYGNLLEEPDADEIEQRIQDEKDFVVYHFPLIRQEIRNIPRITKSSRKARISLLEMYDHITKGHYVRNSIEITRLAKKYYDHYRNLGGTYGWDTNIRIDFIIVACASFYELDIVYSNDQRTMLSKDSLKSYHHINLNENRPTPHFLKYDNLLRKFRDKN